VGPLILYIYIYFLLISKILKILKTKKKKKKKKEKKSELRGHLASGGSVPPWGGPGHPHGRGQFPMGSAKRKTESYWLCSDLQ
jgi:hypothetical protein